MTIHLQSSQPPTTPLHVYLLLFAGVLCVSAAAIFIRFAQADGIPSMVIASGRMLVAALILTPWVLRRHWHTIRELDRSSWLLVIASGVALAAHFATWISSLEYTSVLISVVLVTTTPLWAAVLEVVFLRGRLGRPVIVGMIIAIIGSMTIAFGSDTSDALAGSNNVLGAALALAGAFTVSIYLIIGRKLRATLPLMPYIWLAYGVAAIILCALVAGAGMPVTGYPTGGYLAVVLLAVIPQLFGHTSFNYAMAYVPATVVGIATQLEPISSAFLAYLLFNEVPLPLQIVGSAVVLIGVLTATIGQSRKHRTRKALTS